MTAHRPLPFAPHARAILGLPLPPEHVSLTIPAGSVAASHAIVVAGDGEAEEVGFGAISVFYDRPGYDGVCDLAYYVTARWQRRGVGRFALRTLLNECRARAMRKACAIIFSDNTASNALVESFGFEPFGEMPEAAYDSRGVLHDMSYWCLDLTPLDAKGAVEGIARR